MSTTDVSGANGKISEQLDAVVIRFCGDSGDGMQLAGTQFTNVSAVFGNDVSTLPDFPAEIRAPAGTLGGVSGFQICFSSSDIYTPGDEVDTLIAMNPAALKTNVADLKRGGTLIVNEDAFEKSNLSKAGYDSNPLDDEEPTNVYFHLFENNYAYTLLRIHIFQQLAQLIFHHFHTSRFDLCVFVSMM